MTSTTILTLLLVFSFAIGRFLRRFDTPHFVFSGMIYLVFGLLLGSTLGFGLLTEEILYKLEPMTDLLTGIAGFLLGLRVRVLMQNKRSFLSGTLTATASFVFTAIALFFLAPFVVNFADITLNLSPLKGIAIGDNVVLAFLNLSEVNRHQLWFALGAGATACSISLLSLGTVSKFNKNSSEITRVLSIIAPTGQLVAVSFLGVFLALARADTSSSTLQISMGTWFVVVLLSGLLCGLLFSLFIGRQSDEKRILLAALGAIIFAAGLGTLLNVSALFVCFITGLTISVFSSYAPILKESLIRLEEPVFVLLLVIGGAFWKPALNSGWLLPVAYFAVRAVVFSGLAQVIHKQITNRQLTRLGQGLLGQDLIAVAVALSLSKQFPTLAQLFLTTVLGSIFFNDIVANSLLKKVILDNEQAIEAEPIIIEDEPS